MNSVLAPEDADKTALEDAHLTSSHPADSSKAETPYHTDGTGCGLMYCTSGCGFATTEPPLLGLHHDECLWAKIQKQCPPHLRHATLRFEEPLSQEFDIDTGIAIPDVTDKLPNLTITTYKCDKCSTIFENSGDIIEHYETIQYAKNQCYWITFCSTCQTHFTNKSEFDLHIKKSVVCEFYNPIAFRKSKKQ